MAEEEKTPEVEDIEALHRSLEEEKARAETYLANWQRAQADFQNLKRRAEQEKAEVVKFANAMLLLNLLPALDDLERAFSSISARLAGFTWVEGIHLIYRKLQAALEAQGLAGIKALGEPFNPQLHEAVLYTEGEEGIVIEEVQKGYKLHDRVIRPSLVVVGKGKAEGGEEQPQGG